MSKFTFVRVYIEIEEFIQFWRKRVLNLQSETSIEIASFFQHFKSNSFNVCGVAQTALVSYNILFITSRSINFHDKPRMRRKHEQRRLQ